MDATQEKRAWTVSGFAAFAVMFALLIWLGFRIAGYAEANRQLSPLQIVSFVVHVLSIVLIVPGYFTVQPNQAKALVFFGSYIGSVRESGFFWANPFTAKRRVSLRVRNFNSERLKVNDLAGNPIEIAAVIVWRVIDSAKALFDVDDYEQFVEIQSETALRGLASHYPYDDHQEGLISLRGNQDDVALKLQEEVEARLGVAGVVVIETRLSHLAYAQEIAQAMLRRQQAQAIIAARKQIVEGAVGMVQMALHQLSEQNIVELDEERKATMVNNLLVVLTSEQESQPVLNTGSLY